MRRTGVDNGGRSATQEVSTAPTADKMKFAAENVFLFRMCIYIYVYIYVYIYMRKVAGSIPAGVIGIFYWHNPSDRIMALGSTQPLTEINTRIISWG